MGVYVAYALLVVHVLLGYVQSQDNPASTVLAATVTAGAMALAALHIAAGRREVARDRVQVVRSADGYVDVSAVDEIPEGGACTAIVAGERVAVFRHRGAVHAVSGVCKHQGGPLSEGRIVDGCITCPWHGYQYRPQDGCAPAPFDDRLATFPVRITDGRVLVAPNPLPPGTPTAPAAVGGTGRAHGDSLYVGYLDNASKAQAGRTRGLVVVASAVVAAALLTLAVSQRPLLDSRFEFGVAREFRGVVAAAPCPMLRVPRPGGTASNYLLVAPGKHGADALAAQWNGKGVALRGSIIHQGGQTMIEVEPDSFTPAEVPLVAPAAAEPLGRYTLVGEIVDSKCHLGVMNPGERRTHRACARLCIRGGVPPILWAENGAGEVRRLLLVGVDGTPVNDRVLDLVGDPVEITGDVEQIDGWLVLRADPAQIRRVP
jgi:nitrite reductase/ring-hydroxylating ferredoxin subunit